MRHDTNILRYDTTRRSLIRYNTPQCSTTRLNHFSNTTMQHAWAPQMVKRRIIPDDPIMKYPWWSKEPVTDDAKHEHPNRPLMRYHFKWSKQTIPDDPKRKYLWSPKEPITGDPKRERLRRSLTKYQSKWSKQTIPDDPKRKYPRWLEETIPVSYTHLRAHET